MRNEAPRSYPGGDDIGSNFYPSLGCYSVNEPKVLREHMRQLRQAGVGVLCTSWWGKDTFTDRALPGLFKAAEEADLLINFHIEPVPGRNATTTRRAIAYSTKPAEARKVARDFFDRGFSRQKWFFFNGPVDGTEGLKQNIALAEAVREELGPKALLMFDGIQYVWKSADVDYAIALAKGLLPIKPHWLEEPLRPDDLEGYVRLKGETGITLAAGEHWYTRWNVRPFLERKIVSFVQSDPEWCGGITEWLNICALVKGYPGVQVIPHGHHVLAASNCVASQSETLCPMLEFLFQSRAGFQHCQTRPLMAEGGYFAMAEEPGLGPTLDFARMELELASG